MKRPLTLSLALAIAACSWHGDPIVDQRGVDPVRYEQDLADCEAYADEVPSAEKVAAGIAGGAAIGGAIGAIHGSTAAAQGAGTGAISGAAYGANDAADTRHQVVTTCLRHRGYAVLN